MFILFIFFFIFLFFFLNLNIIYLSRFPTTQMHTNGHLLETLDTQVAPGDSPDNARISKFQDQYRNRWIQMILKSIGINDISLNCKKYFRVNINTQFMATSQK